MFKKTKQKFAKWLTGIDAETIAAHNTEMQQSSVISTCGLSDNYLFDFKNFSSQYNGGILIGNPNSTDKTVPTKIKVKPIDVLMCCTNWKQCQIHFRLL